jgi:uridine phosphorylase
MTYWITANGSIYEGDCQLGDTVATDAQITAWQAAQALIPPPSVTRRQFFQAAAQQGLITQAEALALFTTGTIPSEIATAINALPTAQQFPAQMLLLGALNFERENATLIALCAAIGQTSAQIDALFVLSGEL